MTGAAPGAPAAGCASRAVTRDTHAAPCAPAERDGTLAEKRFRSQHLLAKRLQHWRAMVARSEGCM